MAPLPSPKNLALTSDLHLLPRRSYPVKMISFFRALFLIMFFFFLPSPDLFSIGSVQFVSSESGNARFPLAQNKTVSPLLADPQDFPGVLRAVKNLQSDIAHVTGTAPALIQETGGAANCLVIVGTLGKSRILDQLALQKKINLADLQGKWESFVIQTVPNIIPGVQSGLVIAGSDKRGTIYGVYELSEQIGVSPWYWWADVPIRPQRSLFIKAGRYFQGEPAVRYRGIFLNDEAPALTGWVREKFGNYNHQFYEKVFELLLRLKGNYLWPAMWDNSFATDDPLNPQLADDYGIVMGTSHHEPMMRAWKEWERKGYKKGSWDYSKNSEVISPYWVEGIQRTRNYEKIISLGMRGDGDEPMSVGANIALLEKIVADQRKIIADQINPDVSKVPQLWALYKEVQEYYEKGMRIPDDITLLWCDDNWGNIRRLPTPEERKRSGGAGIYYHFDYVGGPRSYKWINTNPITKVWEQMNLAIEYGENRIWIVNVGDLKPMEFPLEFFLSLAWNPKQWPKEKTAEFGRLWAQREFGSGHAADIADIISKYAKYNGRRKPELLEPATFSLVDYREAETVLADFKTITTKAETIYRDLPEYAKDAFYQLVLFPTKASANLTELYVTTGKNHLYASQKRAATNDLAIRVRQLFQTDQELSNDYNHTMAQGKWNHMMDQTHIGYTFWNQPPQNNLPAVQEITLPEAGAMGVAIEGSRQSWPGAAEKPVLPDFNIYPRDRHFLEVFNRGRLPLDYAVTTSHPWIRVDHTHGSVEKEIRLWASLEWNRVPQNITHGWIRVSSPQDQDVTVGVKVVKPVFPSRTTLEGFVETHGVVSIEAEHYTRKTERAGTGWEKLEDYGRTLSAMTLFPVTSPSAVEVASSPSLEYQIYFFTSGAVEVEALVSPSLNFVPGRGLRFAVSFDDQPPQILDILAHNSLQDWETAVSNNIRSIKSTHQLSRPGYHTLKIRMVDPGVVLQKLVVNTGGLQPSYLGPPESFHRIQN
jgi:hypothetical protein